MPHATLARRRRALPRLTAEGDTLRMDATAGTAYLVRGLAVPGRPLTLIARRREGVHADTLDLYHARARRAFAEAAAAALKLDPADTQRDLGRLLLALERLRSERRAAEEGQQPPPKLTAQEREAALALLRDPDLVTRIGQAYQALGVVGESTNQLLVYLAATSRLLPRPLAVLIQSTSAAGKTTLIEATLALMPPESYYSCSTLSTQSLYYLAPQALAHKILAVAEEEGAREAGYALKLLQSEGRIRRAAAGRRLEASRPQTEWLEAEGPVALLLTTTCERPSAELENRCLLLRVDESAAQTAAIHQRQRQAYTLAGYQAQVQRQEVIDRHISAQRLLAPLPVLIPWADRLGFRHDQTRMRRDQAGYLALIAASAVLHQYQRRRADLPGGEAVEAAPADVELANRLMAEVLGQRLSDLLPQTRALLEGLLAYFRQQAQAQDRPLSQIRATQRELREALAWGDYALRRHLARLVQLEYVLVHRTAPGGRPSYQLLYEGQGQTADEPFLLGLTDPASLT